MATKTVGKVQRELNSYQGLVTLNLMFGALTMAFGIVFIVQGAMGMVEVQIFLLPEIVLVAIGAIVAGMAVRWLISSAELLDGLTDLKEEYNKNKASLNDENIVSLVVKMTSHYRENKPTIKKMLNISKIAGICFLAGGIYILILAITNLAAGVSTWEVFVQIGGSAANIAMAGASFTIPHFFGNYSKVWDYRLEETTKAEKQLQQQLGEFEE
ncbi:MAG: hypothetical protein IAX21_06405 [Candidatus Bathyarchaeota archaeon]|nr:MAG: hypothetical protein NUK63_11025 [Candidatus Bathyarchaeum tardum]WNZ28304.1 MAG: hypothetical protein IAX21_06405 [Candidatus Bathyarchaeota archaeon]